jgi:hypothetical protein
LFSNEYYPQDDSLFLYYPLQVGNKWQFKSTKGYTWTRHIINDTMMFNGKKYSIIIDSTGNYPQRYYERIDSLTFCIYRFESYDTSETMIDSLKASIGDTIWGSRIGGITLYDSISYDTILNVPTSIRYFSTGYIPIFPHYGIAKGFGPVYFAYLEEDPNWPRFYWNYEYLQYVRINGEEFGILLDIKDPNLQNNSFKLSQNYPNPFNSQTRIEFQIPSESFIALKVFDILGREIKTLLQGVRKPGQYSLDYSAEGLSTGIYFLVMEANNYSQTIKMVYLK